MPGEISVGDFFRRIAQTAAMNKIKKKKEEVKTDYKGMSPKYKRAIRSIEKCFTAYRRKEFIKFLSPKLKTGLTLTLERGLVRHFI